MKSKASHSEETFRVAGKHFKEMPKASTDQAHSNETACDGHNEFDVVECAGHGESLSHLIDKDSIKERHYFGHH